MLRKPTTLTIKPDGIGHPGSIKHSDIKRQGADHFFYQ